MLRNVHEDPAAPRRRAACGLVAALFALAGSLATGCAIGPDFTRPAAPVAPAWKGADGEEVEDRQEEHSDWWRVFDDPVLLHLVELASRQNLTLRAAGVRVLEARARLGQAIGELYPQQQQVGASASYNRIPVSIPYDLLSNTYWQAFVGAQAGWEIDLWGKIRRAIESADAAFLAAVASYDDVLVTLTGDVASTYVQIRTLDAQLAIAGENVARQRQAVTIARNRFEGGVVSKRDVYQAENVLAATEAQIPALTVEIEQSKHALAVLLGVAPGELDAALLGSGPIPTAPTRVAVGIPADLLRRRPDVRAAELEAAAQCAQIGVAKADLLPAFSLVGNVGTFASDIGRGSLSDLFTAKTVSYSAGPAVEWNVLNYGQITNNVRVQDALFQELLIEYQNQVLGAQREVENGLVAFVQSRKQVALLRESVAAALGALEIAMNQYKEGTADFTTVLTAEQNLYAAQNDLAIARGDVPLALIATYRALGGGWQIREGHGFVPEQTRDEMAERTDWGTLLTPALLDPTAPGLPGPEDEGGTVRPPEW